DKVELPRLTSTEGYVEVLGRTHCPAPSFGHREHQAFFAFDDRQLFYGEDQSRLNVRLLLRLANAPQTKDVGGRKLDLLLDNLSLGQIDDKEPSVGAQQARLDHLVISRAAPLSCLTSVADDPDGE